MEKELITEIRKLLPYTYRKPRFWLQIGSVLGILALVAFLSKGDLEGKLIVQGIASLIAGGLVLVVVILCRALDNKAADELFEKHITEILAELPNAQHSKSMGAIITENYLIGTYFGIDILPIEGILWTYLHTNSINMLPIMSEVIFRTYDDKVHSFGACFGLSFRKKKAQEELMRILYLKDPRMMIGYSEQNKKLYPGLRFKIRTRPGKEARLQSALNDVLHSRLKEEEKNSFTV